MPTLLPELKSIPCIISDFLKLQMVENYERLSDKKPTGGSDLNTFPY